MRLRAEVVDLVRFNLRENAGEVAGVGQIAVVHREAVSGFVGILVDVIHPRGVEDRDAPLDAVHLIALFEEKLREVAAVLAGYAGDECFFHNLFGLLFPAQTQSANQRRCCSALINSAMMSLNFLVAVQPSF